MGEGKAIRAPGCCAATDAPSLVKNFDRKSLVPSPPAAARPATPDPIITRSCSTTAGLHDMLNSVLIQFFSAPA